MKLNLFVLIIVCSFEGDNGVFLDNRIVRNFLNSGALDVNVLHCLIKNTNVCPHQDVNFRMFTKKSSRHGFAVKVNNPLNLYAAGYSKHRESALIIHGFNGTANDKHLQYLRDAYISRDFNVITVDWRPLTRYPCYLSALVNARLVAQCTAQIYSFLTHYGTPREHITCIGHSLGAHICGMITNHLTTKQYRIIGLDPARPLIERKKTERFRLTRNDAAIIQVIHTNAGYLGQEDNNGHLNYCINGGKYQPFCKGNPIRRSRCSHFLSVCYLANAIFKQKRFLGVACPSGCVEVSGPNRLPVSSINPFNAVERIKEFRIGNDAPDDAYGIFCLDMPSVKHCPFSSST